MITEEVTKTDGSKKTKSTGTRKPRTWRWLKAKTITSKALRKVIDEEQTFCFKPFSYTSLDMFTPLKFGESNKKLQMHLMIECTNSVMFNSDEVPHFFRANLNLQNDSYYNPQKVLRKFSFD